MERRLNSSALAKGCMSILNEAIDKVLFIQENVFENIICQILVI